MEKVIFQGLLLSEICRYLNKEREVQFDLSHSNPNNSDNHLAQFSALGKLQSFINDFYSENQINL